MQKLGLSKEKGENPSAQTLAAEGEKKRRYRDKILKKVGGIYNRTIAQNGKKNQKRMVKSANSPAYGEANWKLDYYEGSRGTIKYIPIKGCKLGLGGLK